MDAVYIVAVGAVVALIAYLGWRSEQRLAESKRQFWAKTWSLSEEEQVKRLDEVYMMMSRMHGSPALSFAQECYRAARAIEARMKARAVEHAP